RRCLGAHRWIHATRDDRDVPARAGAAGRRPGRRVIDRRRDRARGGLDPNRRSDQAPRPRHRRVERGGGGRHFRVRVRDAELGLFGEPRESAARTRRARARRAARAAERRGAPGARGSAARRPRTQGAVEAPPRATAHSGALHLVHVNRAVRADPAALRRNLVRARRAARDEPRDDGRRNARGDLRSCRHQAAGRVGRRSVSRSSARGPAEGRGDDLLCDLARSGGGQRILCTEEIPMKTLVVAVAAVAAVALNAAETKVDLSKEQIGRPPASFEPMVGTWVMTQDAGEKVIMVDGRPWVASKDNPTKLLIESARRLYGTSNEELMDNAKQFAYFPVAVLRSVDSFSNGTISVRFKTISGEADRASGILFNVKPNGDWLAVRYNDTENNVALWEFHNGIRRNVRFSDRARKFMLDRAAWHELKLAVDGADLKTWLHGDLALEYTLGSVPGPGRNNAPPNPDLLPANNAVLRPPG